MGLTVDHSLDYLVWDGVEAVRYTSVRRTGSMADVVPVAMRRQLTVKEQAASRGAYQGGDLIWEVPAVLMQVGPCKPADVLNDVEGDGVDYTVLSADRACEGSVWTLHTRSLAIAYDLQDAVDIERALVAESDTGARLKQWPPDAGTVLYPSLACRVQPVDSEVGEERGLTGFVTKYQVFLSRATPDVTDQDRVKFGAQYLEVRGYHQAEQIGELPWLECELVP